VQTVTSLAVLRTAIADLRASGGAVALVPTMGALHDGHLALVRAARARAAHVVTSIFVNPRQFGPNEDLDAYPRQLARDAELLEREGAALLWAPPPEEVYPAGYATNVSVAGVGEGLCGRDRPGHFDGVATVVLKLFNQIQPDLAVFGEKDWQQLALIRRMARDLDLTQPRVAEILGVPTVREADGLAMSSRNLLLTAEQRAAAAALPAAMQEARGAMRSGTPVADALGELKHRLLAGGFDSVDYVELRDGESLAPLERVAPGARLFVAARIGITRLIDNMPLGKQENG
jgi:pantoate--beta-alanine ligase